MRRFVCLRWCPKGRRLVYWTSEGGGVGRTHVCGAAAPVAVAQKTRIYLAKCRICVLNHCYGTKRKLSATLLLSNFQIRRPRTADWKVSRPIQDSAGASHCWRRSGSTVHSQRTTGRSLTCWPCPKSCRDSVNFSQFQFAYMKGHSTETALLEVVDEVFTAADDK